MFEIYQLHILVKETFPIFKDLTLQRNIDIESGERTGLISSVPQSQI